MFLSRQSKTNRAELSRFGSNVYWWLKWTNSSWKVKTENTQKFRDYYATVIDTFNYWIQLVAPGPFDVSRSSNDSSVTIPFERTFRELEKPDLIAPVAPGGTVSVFWKHVFSFENWWRKSLKILPILMALVGRKVSRPMYQPTRGLIFAVADGRITSSFREVHPTQECPSRSSSWLPTGKRIESLMRMHPQVFNWQVSFTYFYYDD